ncbi:hypothetical protein CO112_02145 [Candidatus Dojkabacteria bacterium CG_4_9_14_3_um_filter_150_Dojkabacteria_WS6_41_13]|uniref:DUF4178 domain-containing protein n=1 Tax=Candidatus Dojkabacteria bacterium CG_4_10_14_0_2_um_filter_Dojkabacteria_WS6_41_15 TaxID=2014249 RepID=A0A2M7W1H6_9BACT|nr:MAG: hypothetical protein COZ14_03150 [Candidatus Dojkabacteria bacterium CG_4_10_14_3_um_filter_Dojkabacteria_WS6_41_9]PJA13415.1 MAG: hypothetical protein COX64_03460 [Candidatus Dojkabacteria bacterium CG_4_10_14_0_2_um_filter_Dojkabacteria_WS6_41_15]PJB22867.1 MAG: hypothetical protein CO112_02145 [Candidatus Dojkabacteria bacterium CG_4_9_14_3_um_filter_150_Dojkabacteria_WS6_41_13]
MKAEMKRLLDMLLTKEITIKGKVKLVLGMARFATVNSPAAEYVKVSFTDGSGMYFLLDEVAIFYFDQKIGTTEGITDEMIGSIREITWNGKLFTVTNPNDYQYVKEFYLGTIENLEGDVRFSDYEDINGNVLSLGLNMFEGKRDDVFAKPLSFEDITGLV